MLVMFRKVFVIFMFLFLVSSVYSAEYSVCKNSLQNGGEIPTGEHVLTADIFGDNDYCFVFHDDNVTIDCQGHIVDGDGDASGYGFYPVGKNFTLKNCIISDFGRGVSLINAPNSTLINVTIFNTTSYGLYIKTSPNFYANDITIYNVTSSAFQWDGGNDNSEVYNLDIRNVNAGVSGDASNNITYVNVSVQNISVSYALDIGGDNNYLKNLYFYNISGNGLDGIGDNSVIDGLVVDGGSTNGLYSGGVVNTTIRNVWVNDSSSVCVRVDGMVNSTVTNVTAENCNYCFMITTGIYSENSFFDDIDVSFCSLYGIYLRNVATSRLTNFKIYNSTDGLYLYMAGTNNTLISNGVIVNNTDDGIYCNGAKYNTIRNTRIEDNGGLNLRFFTGCVDNIFYNNYFDSLSSNPTVSYYNYYNTTLSGQSVGNYWGGFWCVFGSGDSWWVYCLY